MKRIAAACALWLVPALALAAGPTVTLSTATPQYSRSAHVVAVFSETVSGFGESGIALSDFGLSVSNFAQTSSTTYEFDVAPGGGNLDATISIPAGVASSSEDAAQGNEASAPLSFSFNTDYVHGFLSGGTDINSAQALPAYANAPFTAYAVFNAPYEIADFTADDVAATNAAISSVATTSFLGNYTVFSFLVTPQADGSTTLALPAGVVATGYGNLAFGAIATTYDATPPAIALVGSSTAEVELGATYIDPGATALDALEGGLTAAITASGSVDTATLGTYTLRYDVSDAAGNEASTTRSVEVIKKAQTITIDPIADKTVGDSPFDVAATTTSGLALTLAASGACTIATTTITLAAAGSCTVVAAQAGDDTFAAATTSRTFAVAAPASGDGGGGGGSGSGGNGPITPVPQDGSLYFTGAVIPTAPADAGSAAAAPAGQGEVLGAESYRFTSYLVRGADGDAVTQLQRLLIALAFLAPGNDIGHFGPLTQAAVRAYQAARGISQTGTVGPITRASLNKETVSL